MSIHRFSFNGNTSTESVHHGIGWSFRLLGMGHSPVVFSGFWSMQIYSAQLNLVHFAWALCQVPSPVVGDRTWHPGQLQQQWRSSAVPTLRFSVFFFFFSEPAVKISNPTFSSSSDASSNICSSCRAYFSLWPQAIAWSIPRGRRIGQSTPAICDSSGTDTWLPRTSSTGPLPSTPRELPSGAKNSAWKLWTSCNAAAMAAEHSFDAENNCLSLTQNGKNKVKPKTGRALDLNCHFRDCHSFDTWFQQNSFQAANASLGLLGVHLWPPACSVWRGALDLPVSHSQDKSPRTAWTLRRDLPSEAPGRFVHSKQITKKNNKNSTCWSFWCSSISNLDPDVRSNI